MILYSIWGTTKWMTFHKILFAMSTVDVLFSFVATLGTILAPRDSGVVGAMGNTATCSLEGFFTLLNIAVPMYNGTLCIYYLLTIRLSVSQETMILKYEKLLVMTPIAYALLGCFVSLGFRAFNVYDFLPGGCFIAEKPLGCSDDPDIECERGILPYGLPIEILSWVFLTFPFVVSLVVVFVCNVLIYRTVRANFRPLLTQRRRFNETLSIRIEDKIASVMSQCFLYVSAFVLVYLPDTILLLSTRMGSEELDKKHYPTLLAARFILLLQGL